ncbi:MAG: MFS transporter [Frankiaceae bacterium]
MRALLRRPDFARLYATRLISQGSDGVLQASLASAVLFNPQHQTDPASLAASFTVVLLPYSVVGPFAGVFLDRWRRQRVLVVGNLVRAAVVCLTAGLLAGLGPESVALYAAALVAISVNRFYLAALSAALPHVVAERDLVMANSVSTTSGTVATIVGGGLALALRAVVGPGDGGSALIALAAAAGYVASSLVAGRFDATLLGPTARPEPVPLRGELAAVAHGLAAGARHVRARHRTRDALAAIASHRFFYGISTIATILLYRNHFRDHGLLRAGVAGLAEIFAASAVGVLAAAAVTPVVTRRLRKETWIALTLAGAAVVELALGLPYLQATFVPAAALLGFVAQATKICVDTTVQETVDDDFLGRVFAGYDMLFNITFVVAALASVAWLPADGVSYPAIVVIAVGYAATAALYGRASSRRHARLTPAQQAAELTPAG